MAASVYDFTMRLKGQNSSYDQSIKKSAANNKNFTNSALGVSKGLTAINGPLNGITGRFTALSSLATGTAGKIALVGAAFAAASLAAASSLKEYAAYEVHQLKTAQLLEATGYAAGLSAQALTDNAHAVALATLASVDGIQEAQGVLLTFKSIQGETFNEAIMLAQDMAAVFGGSVAAKATQLGKALEDPVQGLNALRKSGVSATQSQKDLIKSLVDAGDAAEAQQTVLGMLRDQVGGAGAAQAGGLAGSVDTLGQRWDELQIKWATSSGSAKAVTGWINSLATAFYNLGEAIDPSVETLEKKLKKVEQLLADNTANRAANTGFMSIFAYSEESTERLTKQVEQARQRLLIAKAYAGDMDAVSKSIAATRANLAGIASTPLNAKDYGHGTGGAGVLDQRNEEMQAQQLTDLLALQKKINREKEKTLETQAAMDDAAATEVLANQQDSAQPGLNAVLKAQASKQELEEMGAEQRQAYLDAAHEAELINDQRWNELTSNNWQAHQQKLTDIAGKESKKRAANEAAAQKAAYSAIATATGQFLVALEGAGKKRSALYKAMFLAQKAAAIPGMIASTEEGATAALKLGPVAGPPAAMGIRAMGYASIGLVAGQAIAGIAHGGMGYIPEESTYLLQKGEGVLSPKQNVEVQKMASEFNAGKSSAAPVAVNIIEDAGKAGQVEPGTGMNGEDVINAFVSNIHQGGEASQVLEQKYGLSRVGR